MNGPLNIECVKIYAPYWRLAPIYKGVSVAKRPQIGGQMQRLPPNEETDDAEELTC